MNINNYIIPTYLNTWDEFCKKIQFVPLITKEKAIEIKTNYPNSKDNLEDLIYLTCITDLYNNGPKCIEPSYEQCIVFQNIEANIPLKEYNQIYRSVIIELPQEYKSYLQSKYKSAPPNAIITYWNKGIFLCTIFFARKDPCIIMYISPRHENDTIEYSIVSTLEKHKDYLTSADVMRMAINLNLFAVNFGHERNGFKNIKQHRFFERKKPEKAKKDIEYFSLKQNIKLYKKETYVTSNNGTHASPKPHWRRGYMRNQHYGTGNSLKKLIFIMPVFVCSEKFKGDIKDTEVDYKGVKDVYHL